MVALYLDENVDVEVALRQFRRLCTREQIFYEVKRRKEYLKPSVKKRLKRQRVRQIRRALMKQARQLRQPESLKLRELREKEYIERKLKEAKKVLKSMAIKLAKTERKVLRID